MFELSKVDVFDFLDALSIRNISKVGDEFNFSCPFDGHTHGDLQPSAYMNTYTTAWICHGCKRRGNAVHFLSKLENISPLASLRHIRERYETDFREPGDSLLDEFDSMFFGNFEDHVERAEVAPLINFYKVDWTSREALCNIPKGCAEYIFGRGFRPDTLVEWGVGYCHDVERITLPVIDFHGDLRGFKGRAWRPEHKPKYLVLGDAPGREVRFGFPTYEKSNYVFGIQAATSTDAVIVEGELNCIALSQNLPRDFDISPVALNGSDISFTQARQLAQKFSHVTIFMDSDPAGVEGTRKVIRELIDYCPVSCVDAHEGDPAELTGDECVSLIESATPVVEMIFNAPAR